MQQNDLMNVVEEDMNNDEIVSWEMDFMEAIPLYFLFVDLNNHLVRVEKDVYEFPDMDDEEQEEQQIVPFSAMISKIKKWSGSRYKLADTLLFETSDLEHDDLVDFVEGDDLEKVVAKHFKVLPFLNDVSFSPSMIMPQSTHGLYFVLKEKYGWGSSSGNKPKLVFADGLSDEVVETRDFSLNGGGKTRRNNRPFKRFTRRRRRGVVV